MEIRNLGITSYLDALSLLKESEAKVCFQDGSDTIFITSHYPVITLGRRADATEVLIDTWSRLFNRIELLFSPRGGGATAHNPDQEVIYPVLCLQRLGLKIPLYIKMLADSAIEVLKQYDINAAWDESRPGVYVGKKKIASIGLHVSKGAVSHGMSINIGKAQKEFSLIHPCKEPGLSVTSIEELTGQKLPAWEVSNAIARKLSEVLIK